MRDDRKPNAVIELSREGGAWVLRDGDRRAVLHEYPEATPAHEVQQAMQRANPGKLVVIRGETSGRPSGPDREGGGREPRR